MKKGRFLWSAHRITEKQKAGKARNIKEKQLKNSRNTVSRPPAALRSSASADRDFKMPKNPGNSRVSVHKDVFSYERLVAASVIEAATFSLSAVDHGLDDSAIASISFMVARSTSPTPVKWMSIPTRLCPFTISLL